MKLDLKKAALTVLVESFDLKKLAKGLLDNVIEAALDEVVKDSSTDFDNMAKAALWPVLEEKLKTQIDKELDLKDLLKVEEA